MDNFDTATFVRDYWQKKPLLIRNPWSDWVNPIDPDELAGLACEEEVESRLIVQAGDTLTLENGPLSDEHFEKLGSSHWTILVQAVDHFVPDVAALIEPFRFIPNWRIDDVMVSYAADQGGVGPHFDHYDVFLVQGLGQRRWQIGQMCDDTTALLPHDDLRLLADFQVVEEWVLEPGDILYVPPGVAHNGIGVGDDCMTYSIGFRAPSRRELIGDWCDDMLAALPDDDRYTDPDFAPQANPGEISPESIDRLHKLMTETLLDKEAFARWFGVYNSSPKYPDRDWRPEEQAEIAELRSAVAEGVTLGRNPASHFAFIAGEEGSIALFIDGECFDCTGETALFAQELCAEGSFDLDPALAKSDAVMELITTLYNQGNIGFVEEYGEDEEGDEA